MSAFRELPLDVLHPVLLCLKGDLKSLARCAHSGQLLNRHCRPLLQRTWHCRACQAELFQRGNDTYRVGTAYFQDGPAIVAHTGLEALQIIGTRDCVETNAPLFSRVLRGRSRALWHGGGTQKLQESLVVCKDCERFLGSRFQVAGGGEERSEVDFWLLCEPYLVEMELKGEERSVVKTETSETILHCSGIRSSIPAPRGEHRASACGQPLFRLDSVLSRHHMWRIPGYVLESAWYINDFIPDAIYVRSASPHQLAQGLMETADVLCARCHGVVGWKFASDLCAKKHNIHHVHRFGICRSSILEEKDVTDDLESDHLSASEESFTFASFSPSLSEAPSSGANSGELPGSPVHSGEL
ncbi:Replicase polyprotein 1ab [Durusdinium trenchii]